MRARMQDNRRGLTEYFEVTCWPSQKVRLRVEALRQNMTMQEYVRWKLFRDWSGNEAEKLKDAQRDLREEIREKKRMAKNTLARKLK